MDPLVLRVAARFAAALSEPEQDALRLLLKFDKRGEPLEMKPAFKPHLKAVTSLGKRGLVNLDEGDDTLLVTLTDKGVALAKSLG